MEHDKRILTPVILGEYTAKVNTLFFVRSQDTSRGSFGSCLFCVASSVVSEMAFPTESTTRESSETAAQKSSFIEQAPSRYRLFHLSSRA